MPRDLWANNFVTTLGAAVNTTPAAGTPETWTLTTTTGLPQVAGQTRLLVDTEIVIATTPPASGTTVVVTRGAEGSTVATHANGATVRQIVTKGALESLVPDAQHRANDHLEILDDFERANSASMGFTSVHQREWFETSWEIVNGHARNSAASYSIAWFDPHHAYGAFSVVLGPGCNSAEWWAVVRLGANGDYVRVGRGATNVWGIQKIVGGGLVGFTVMLSRNTPHNPPAPGDVLRVVNLPSDGIDVYVNDVLYFSGGDTYNMEERGVGLASVSTTPTFPEVRFLPIGGGDAVNAVHLTGAETITGLKTFQPASAAVVGQIIRGAVSQSAHLQQWQDSAGATLAYVQSDGVIATPRVSATTFAGTYLQHGSLGGPYIQMDPSAIVAYNRTAVANVVFTVRGMAGQTGDLQQWVDSAGDVWFRVGADGTVSTGSDETLPLGGMVFRRGALVSVRIRPSTSARVALVVQGQSAQSGDLQHWRNSSDVAIAKVTSAGDVVGASGWSDTDLGVFAAMEP